MEATAVQPVTNSDVGRESVGFQKGSEQAPEGDFSVLVEKLIAEEEQPETLVSSEDVTPESVGGEEKTETGEKEVFASLVATFVAEPKASEAGEILDGESPAAIEATNQNPSPDPLGKELAPGLVETRPAPANGEFSDRLVQIVTKGPASENAKDVSPHDVLPRPADSEFAEALSNLVRGESQEGQPSEVSPLEVPSGLGPADVEEAPGQTNAKVSGVGEAQEQLMSLVEEEISEAVRSDGPEENPAGTAEPVAIEEKGAPKSKGRLMDIPGLVHLDKGPDSLKARVMNMNLGDGEARSSISPDVPQKHELKAEKVGGPSFLVGVDSSKEIQPAATLPNTPKESVGVETVMLVPPGETNEAEVEPIKPVNGGDIAQTNSRSAEGLEAAKGFSQAQSSASIQDAPAATRPSTPPIVGRIVDKVVEVVQAGNHHERHEVSIQLSPPALGKVHLKVMVEDSKLHVALFTTTQEARELVESNTSQLRNALHQQGLMLEQFSVGVRSGLAHNMPQQDWLGWQESFASGQFFQGTGAANSEAASDPRVYQRRDALSRVDLFI